MTPAHQVRQEAWRDHCSTRSHARASTAINVRDAFYEIRRTHGITTIFGNRGSNELPLLSRSQTLTFCTPCTQVSSEAVRLGLLCGGQAVTRNLGWSPWVCWNLSL